MEMWDENMGSTVFLQPPQVWYGMWPSPHISCTHIIIIIISSNLSIATLFFLIVSQDSVPVIGGCWERWELCWEQAAAGQPSWQVQGAAATLFLGAVILLHFMSVLTPLILFNASYASPLILCLYSQYFWIFSLFKFLCFKILRSYFTQIYMLTSGKDFGIEKLHIFPNKAILRQIC